MYVLINFVCMKTDEIKTEIHPLEPFFPQGARLLMLGDAEQLKTGYMLAEHENLVDEGEFFESKELTVRIRYRSKPIPCDVKRLEDGRLLVHFQTEASAIAPGQSAVFYIGRRVVGGSFIASQRGIGMFL